MLREQLEGEQQGHQQGERNQRTQEGDIEQQDAEREHNTVSHHRLLAMDNAVQPHQ